MEENIELIEDVAEREADVDAMLYLVERQVRVALDSHLVASSLKVSRHQALEYSNLAKKPRANDGSCISNRQLPFRI